MSPRVMTITLPESADEFGRWLERNGGRVELSCSMGAYTVSVSWRKVHSYSDEQGLHRETWELSRHGKDFQKTFEDAMQAALEKTKAKP